MKSYFSSDFFAGNRRRLREQIKGDTPIVVTANGQVQKSGDTAFPFKQDTNFWYLTGLDKPDITLVLDKNEEYLIIPELSSYQNSFDGSLESAELSKRSGISQILDSKTGWQRLSEHLTKASSVGTVLPPPTYLKIYGTYTNPARRRLVQKIKRVNPGVKFRDLRPELAELRMVKQSPELAAIEKAIDITSETIKEVADPKKIASYKYEYQVEAEISYGFKKRGGGIGFDSIIAAGQNATTIHSMSPHSTIQSSDLIILDVGAEIEQYSADITRTFSVNGRPSKRQQEIFEAVLDVQNYALGLQKPGPSIRENERLVEQYMGEKLRELGLINTDKREDIRRYFPHATSHFLGLDVHDLGDYDAVLKPGMVLTVEPGIYIHEEGIGVRIEDDILITPTGYKNLSAGLPRELL